ncbi:MAG: type II toxin-antitoxin system VapB family antitoxin [Bryobacterales bacterium]|nr:type II toxin-antitoxin system VapB family antitoxin [Bryobacterales bacterium]
MKPVKKTWLIDPALVKRAKKACGARTETETVTLALRELLVRLEIDAVFERHSKVLSGIEPLFPDEITRTK